VVWRLLSEPIYYKGNDGSLVLHSTRYSQLLHLAITIDDEQQ
jgi:hypothetical protein